MSKKKLPPKFVKAPDGMDSPLRATGEATMVVAPPVLPSDGFVHEMAARFSREAGAALEAAAKTAGMTTEALLRKLVDDWMAAQPTPVEATPMGSAEPRARGIIEAVVERAVRTLSRFGIRSTAMSRLAGWLSPA